MTLNVVRSLGTARRLRSATELEDFEQKADESRFRMQVITATARTLLRHFPAAT